MEHIIDNHTRTSSSIRPNAEADVSGPAYEAYQILHVAFVVAPIVAGLDSWATAWEPTTSSIGAVVKEPGRV